VYDCGHAEDVKMMKMLEEHKKYCTASYLKIRNPDRSSIKAFATKDLKPGQIICQEYPFICGPSDNKVAGNTFLCQIIVVFIH